MAEYEISLTDAIGTTDTLIFIEPNYYGNLVQANIYFANRLRTELWSAASPSNRTLALIQATEDINQLLFAGSKTDDSQTNEFPRDDSLTIPDPIAYATYEQAFALIKLGDVELEYKAAKIKREKFDSHEIEFFDRQMTPHVAAGVLSVKAWRYLLPYLYDGSELTLMKV